MHIVLTDILTCPVCGPDFGLIVLARQIDNRRVLEGQLGCPNCERHFQVEAGLAHLYAEAPVHFGEPEPASPERAVQIAAFAGLQEGRGLSLLIGGPAGQAEQLAALVPNSEVIVLADGLEHRAEQPGINRIAAGAQLPFGNNRLRAVALSGAQSAALLAEVRRVLTVTGRLVWLDVPADAEALLEAAGLRVIARDTVNLIAVRTG